MPPKLDPVRLQIPGVGWRYVDGSFRHDSIVADRAFAERLDALIDTLRRRYPRDTDVITIDHIGLYNPRWRRRADGTLITKHGKPLASLHAYASALDFKRVWFRAEEGPVKWLDWSNKVLQGVIKAAGCGIVREPGWLHFEVIPASFDPFQLPTEITTGPSAKWPVMK